MHILLDAILMVRLKVVVVLDDLSTFIEFALLALSPRAWLVLLMNLRLFE
jgi:hypothetical protein